MIWKELKQETLFLLKNSMNPFRIDFGSVRVWVQLFLAAVLLAVNGMIGVQNRSNTEDIAQVKAAVSQLQDSIRTQHIYHEKVITKIGNDIKVLSAAGVKREKAMAELVRLLEKHGISQQEALRAIDKMNQTQLEQYFSTLPNE